MLTIHDLCFPPDSTFDTAGSASNRVWNEALIFLVEQPGAHIGRWGRTFENENRVILVVSWFRSTDARRFISEAYDQFENKIAPILSSRPSAPDIADMNSNWIMPGHKHTTIYKNTFSQVTPEERRWNLLLNISFYTQCLHGGVDGDVDPVNKGYINSGYGWAVDPSTGQNTTRAYIAIVWQSLEDEKESQENFMCDDGSRSMSQALLYDNVLDRADAGGECFRVSWRHVRVSDLRSSLTIVNGTSEH